MSSFDAIFTNRFQNKQSESMAGLTEHKVEKVDFFLIGGSLENSVASERFASLRLREFESCLI